MKHISLFIVTLCAFCPLSLFAGFTDEQQRAIRVAKEILGRHEQASKEVLQATKDLDGGGADDYGTHRNNLNWFFTGAPPPEKHNAFVAQWYTDLASLAQEGKWDEYHTLVKNSFFGRQNEWQRIPPAIKTLVGIIILGIIFYAGRKGCRLYRRMRNGQPVDWDKGTNNPLSKRTSASQ